MSQAPAACSGAGRGVSAGGLRRGLEREPVEAVTGQREQVAELPDGRERDPAHALDGSVPGELAQVEFDRLRIPRQVVDAEDGAPGGSGTEVTVHPDEGEHGR